MPGQLTLDFKVIKRVPSKDETFFREYFERYGFGFWRVWDDDYRLHVNNLGDIK